MFLNCYLISYCEQPLPGKGARDLALAPTQYASTRLASGPAARLHILYYFYIKVLCQELDGTPGEQKRIIQFVEWVYSRNILLFSWCWDVSFGKVIPEISICCHSLCWCSVWFQWCVSQRNVVDIFCFSVKWVVLCKYKMMLMQTTRKCIFIKIIASVCFHWNSRQCVRQCICDMISLRSTQEYGCILQKECIYYISVTSLIICF